MAGIQILVQTKVKDGFMCYPNCVLYDLRFDYIYICPIYTLC